LKLQHDEPLSSFAFKFDLRHYLKGTAFLWHQVRCIAAVLFLVGLGRGGVENNHATDAESPPPILRVCVSNDPEGASCGHVR